MVAALQTRGHIQAQGTIHGPGKAYSHYLLRYQAGGREYEQMIGTEFSNIVVGNKRLKGQTVISIGRKAYRNIGTKQWFSTARAGAPKAVDVLALNSASAPCCVKTSVSSSKVYLAKAGPWHGHRVDTIRFELVASTGYIAGTVYVASASHLPLGYDENTAKPYSHGSFTISYNGKFSIKAP